MSNVSKSIQIVRTMKQVMDQIKQNMVCQFKEMGLTAPQGMLMGTLSHHGRMKISDLSEIMGLSNSTVSGILDRLEKQGMITRSRSEEDRRVVYVEATPEYLEQMKEKFKEAEKLIAGKISQAGEDEMDKVLEGLKVLSNLTK